MNDHFRKLNKTEIEKLKKNYGSYFRNITHGWITKKTGFPLTPNGGEYELVVTVFDWGKWLQIRRNGGCAVIDEGWMFMQDLKDFAFGEEVGAIEVFPKHSELCNKSHTRHLWVLNDIKLPNLKTLKNEGKLI